MRQEAIVILSILVVCIADLCFCKQEGWHFKNPSVSSARLPTFVLRQINRLPCCEAGRRTSLESGILQHMRRWRQNGPAHASNFHLDTIIEIAAHCNPEWLELPLHCCHHRRSCRLVIQHKLRACLIGVQASSHVLANSQKLAVAIICGDLENTFTCIIKEKLHANMCAWHCSRHELTSQCVEQMQLS